MAEALEDAVESDDKRVAILIAILALFLALSEAGGKNAQHLSTEKNIEASDLFNFYQAKKVRSTILDASAGAMTQSRASVADAKVQAGMDKQIEDWKAQVARLENDPKKPEDSMEKILEKAKGAKEDQELANRRLEHYEFAAGLIQIAIVLASAAIITGVAALSILSIGLGLIGAIILAFGYFSPLVLTFLH